MTNIIQRFIVGIFGKNSFFATFFISMIPVVELKGAIPFGMSEQIFGSSALPWYLAWFASAIGGLVPAFFLVWLFLPITRWLRSNRLFCKLSCMIEKKLSNNAKQIEDSAKNAKNKHIKKLIGLITFVAIPLPLTGVYTGSAIASFMSLNYLTSILCILIGNIISGGIVVLLCTIFAGCELYLFGAFVLILVGLLLFKIIKNTLQKKEKLIK